MDAETAQVLALADYPTFDPNERELSSPRHLRRRRRWSDAYEPGSVEKVLTLQRPDQRGLRDAADHSPSADLPLGGYVSTTTSGTRRCTSRRPACVAESPTSAPCWPPSEDARRASCTPTCRSSGSGSRPDIGLAASRPACWRRRTLAADQRRTRRLRSGPVRQRRCRWRAPIATVANGGVYIAAIAGRGHVDTDGHVTPAPAPRARIGWSRHRRAHGRRRMMEAVVGPERHRAGGARSPGYRVAGKTGTAQRVDASCGCYDGSSPSPSPASRRRTTRASSCTSWCSNPSDGNCGGSRPAPGLPRPDGSPRCRSYGVPPTGTRAPHSRDPGDRR